MLIVITTFTPYGDLGNAKHFGSKGMLYSVLLIVLMYGIPFIFYKLHVMGMKYILAVIIKICTIRAVVIFILMGLSIMLIVVKLSFFELLKIKNFVTIVTGIICISTIISNFA